MTISTAEFFPSDIHHCLRFSQQMLKLESRTDTLPDLDTNTKSYHAYAFGSAMLKEM